MQVKHPNLNGMIVIANEQNLLEFFFNPKN